MGGFDIETIDKRIIELRRQLERSPDDPALLNQLGGLYYRKGNLKDAEAAYRRAVDILGTHPAYRNNLANVLMDAGKTREGIEQYRKAVELDSDEYSEAAVNLELAELENRIIFERVRFFSKSIDLNINTAESHTALGCARILEGKLGLALESFRATLADDAKSQAAAENIAYAHSLLVADGASPDAGLDAIDALLLAFPDSPRLFLYRADLRDAAGQTDEAVADYLRAAELDDRLVDAFELAARTAADDDDDESAERVIAFIQRRRRWLETLDRDYGYDIVSERARLTMMSYLLSAGAVDTAAERAALTEKRDVLDDAAQALAAWRKAHPPHTPGWPEAARLNARVEKILGRTETEYRILLESAQELPKDAQILFALGTASLSGGRLDEAVERLTAATFEASDDAQIFNSLRYAFEMLRIYRRERFYFKRAVHRAENDADAYARMSRAETAIYNYGEAENFARQAVAIAPDNADALTALGLALSKLGRKKEAVEMYNRALASNPEQSDAHHGLTALLLSDRDTRSQGLQRLEE